MIDQAETEAIPVEHLARLKQLVRLKPKRSSQAFDIVQRDVPGLSFDMRHKRAMQPSLKGQFLLGPLAVSSKPDQIDS